MSGLGFRLALVACAIVAIAIVVASRRLPYELHEGEGDLLAVHPNGRSCTISHEDIPGLMPAMTMRFRLATPAILRGIETGSRVRFQVRREDKRLTLTGATRIGDAQRNPESIHDHASRHGGVVGMAGMLHLEVAASADGHVRLYVTDLFRDPVTLEGARGTVRLSRDGAEETHRLRLDGDALVATASAATLVEEGSWARFDLVLDGEALDIEFPIRPTPRCTPPRHGASLEASERSGARLLCAATLERSSAFLHVAGRDRVLLSAGEAGVLVWRFPPGEMAVGFGSPPAPPDATAATLHGHVPNAVASSPDGKRALVAVRGRLFVYEVDSGRIERELPPQTGFVRDLAWSIRDEILATRSDEPLVRWLDANGHEIRALDAGAPAATAAFSPDGNRAAIGTEYGRIRVFDLTSDDAPRDLEDSMQAITHLRFLGGETIVAAGDDGWLRVWNVERARVVGRASVGSRVLRLAVHPAGNLAATVARDHMIRLHAIPDGDVVREIPFHEAVVSGLGFAGDALLSTDGDGVLAAWDVDPPEGAGAEPSGGEPLNR